MRIVGACGSSNLPFFPRRAGLQTRRSFVFFVPFVFFVFYFNDSVSTFRSR
jgi:hypothetical protein